MTGKSSEIGQPPLPSNKPALAAKVSTTQPAARRDDLRCEAGGRQHRWLSSGDVVQPERQLQAGEFAVPADLRDKERAWILGVER